MKLAVLAVSKNDRKSALIRSKISWYVIFWLSCYFQPICDLSWKNDFFDRFLKIFQGQNTGFSHFWQMTFLNLKLVILTIQKSIEKSLYNGQKWSDFHFFGYFGNSSLLVTFSEKTIFFTIFRFFFAVKTCFLRFFDEWNGENSSKMQEKTI